MKPTGTCKTCAGRSIWSGLGTHRHKANHKLSTLLMIDFCRRGTGMPRLNNLDSMPTWCPGYFHDEKDRSKRKEKTAVLTTAQSSFCAGLNSRIFWPKEPAEKGKKRST